MKHKRQPMRQSSFKVRCKCEDCGRFQIAEVAYIAQGNATCQLRSLTRPNCIGKLNYYSGDYSDTISNALAVLQYINAKVKVRNPHLAELVDVVADDLGITLEGQQTPQEMGWVGQDGRP